MPPVTIVIPVYKAELSEYEKISFNQALRILGEHKVTLVCNEKLDVSSYQSIAEANNCVIEFEYFDSSYFEGIDGYNKLMLSLDFYKRFLDSEYILIYQLDCFVFRDELKEWIEKGYDYVGAPWLHNDRRAWWTLKNRIRYTLKALYRRYTNKSNAISIGFYKVGNGGLSLRKVEKCCEIIRRFEKNKRIDQYRNSNGNYLYAEDVFWGCEVNRYFHNIRIPGYKKALNFSFDMNPALCYELNNCRLPFGCHAWYRYDLGFWKTFIEKNGYIIG
ncbi:DUF5672 family protein [Dysgonomonas sp. 520]|uniref:DUF5672 family protein n=1 Tax=Dysgonomonas sp. 520 TaxID=2302931 RepID=UPI0013D87B21|nr:DUF5672 family protein [Dysgonomonas sp. 520]NDW09847.1 hypothetical protein [Dysgonomonas sp. 520]